MAYELSEKSIVVTGAACGIGYAIADHFLQTSVKIVIIVDINDLGVEAARNLKTKYGEQKVEFYKCDVTTDLNVFYKNVIERYKTIDVLVNCAGVAENEIIRRTIDVNTTALIEWSLKFFEHMRIDKSGKGGTIVNVASILGYQILPYAPVYQASKFAVVGFTKSLGHLDNFNKFGVRVVAICPGFTETTLGNNAKPYISETRSDLMKFLEKIRFQTVDVVGKATVDLFAMAASGTVWEVAESKPLVLVK